MKNIFKFLSFVILTFIFCVGFLFCIKCLNDHRYISFCISAIMVIFSMKELKAKDIDEL